MALKCIVKFGYGIGHVTNDLCSTIWFTYVLIFYEYVLGFNTMLSGLIMIIGQIADALATPVVGVLCDRGPSFWIINLRKRKLWYSSGSILLLITFPFLFFECLGCKHESTVIRFTYYAIFVIVFQIAWAAVQIAHLAIAPDLTLEEHERTVLMSLRNTFTVLSSLFVYLMVFFLLNIKRGEIQRLNPADIGNFQIIVICSLILGAITSLFFYFSVKEIPSRQKPRITDELKAATYSQLFCDISLYQIALVYMGARIFWNVSQCLLPLYLNITLKLDKPTIASMPFVMFTSSFVSSLISSPLNNLIGRKFTFLTGAIFSVGASVWIKFDTTNFYKTYMIYLVTIMLGVASSLLLVTALAVAADHIGDDINNSAFLYGVLSFVDKLACGVVIMVIQSIKQLFGPMYYRDAMAYVCSGSSILALVCIMTWKKKTNTESTN